MAAKLSKSEKIHLTVTHPEDVQFHDLLSFIQHEDFYPEWKALGLNDDDLQQLEVSIMVKDASASLQKNMPNLRYIIVRTDERPDRRAIDVTVVYYLVESRSIAYLIAADNGEMEISDAEMLELEQLTKEIEKEIENLR